MKEIEEINFSLIGKTIQQAELVGEVLVECRKTRKKMSYETIRNAFITGPTTAGRKLAINCAIKVLTQSSIPLVPEKIQMVSFNKT